MMLALFCRPELDILLSYILSVSYQGAQFQILEHIWYFVDSSHSPHSSGNLWYRHTAAGMCCFPGSLLSRLSLEEKANRRKYLSDNRPRVYEPPVLPICFA